jgi:hypothetical protein
MHVRVALDGKAGANGGRQHARRAISAKQDAGGAVVQFTESKLRIDAPDVVASLFCLKKKVDAVATLIVAISYQVPSIASGVLRHGGYPYSFRNFQRFDLHALELLFEFAESYLRFSEPLFCLFKDMFCVCNFCFEVTDNLFLELDLVNDIFGTHGLFSCW